MGTRPWPSLALLVGALSSGCARDTRPPEAPDARTLRVVPRGLGDDELLEAAEWRLEGLPALSRDGRHVATVLSPSTGIRAIVDEACAGAANADRTLRVLRLSGR